MVRKTLFLKHSPPHGIPKLRHREEKKKIIKLCIQKLKTIDDSESLLFKSVLITNTIRNIKQMDFSQTEFENRITKETEDEVTGITKTIEENCAGYQEQRKLNS